MLFLKSDHFIGGASISLENYGETYDASKMVQASVSQFNAFFGQFFEADGE